MKTFRTILSIAMIAGCCSTTIARNLANSSDQQPTENDTIILATYEEDDYLVKRYMVNVPDVHTSDYSVLYSINLTRLQPDLDDNNEALNALNGFIEQTMADTTRRIANIEITGYASPDGPLALNERLSSQRAQDFKNYVDKKYNLSSRYTVITRGIAEDWENCTALIKASNTIPHKERAMAVIDSTLSDNAKEAALKKMNDVWDYMRKNILPPLRRVEIAINYAQGTIVEERTLIKPIFEEKVVEEEIVPRNDTKCCRQCDEMCICQGNGMIIEVDDALLHMIQGVVTEQIDAELIEVEIPTN